MDKKDKEEFEYLKDMAIVDCHSIYNDFSREEVLSMPMSVRVAWHRGSELEKLINKEGK